MVRPSFLAAMHAGLSCLAASDLPAGSTVCLDSFTTEAGHGKAMRRRFLTKGKPSTGLRMYVSCSRLLLRAGRPTAHCVSLSFKQTRAVMIQNC